LRARASGNAPILSAPTAAAGMASRNDVAKAALQELRRAQPNISLAWIAKQMPTKLDAEREHNVEGFRRAGLE
jgi:hypothetical protein